MLTLKIALRYLIARKSHSVVNVISAISIAGVAVATAAILVVLSVFNGFTDLSREQFSHIDPDLLLTPVRGKIIDRADSLGNVAAAVEGVAAVAPTITERALATGGSEQLGVVFVGIDSRFGDVADLSHIIVDGEVLDSLPEAWLGASPEARPSAVTIGVLSQMGTAAREITLNVPRRRGRINPANPAASLRRAVFMPTAIVQTDRLEVDGDHLFIPIDAARALLDYDVDQATELHIALEPGADAERVARAMSKAVGDDYRVDTRARQQAESFHMIAIEKWVTFMMLVFILVIATFNIISTLSLMVIEKRDNMATLRFMGASRSAVRRVFEALGSMITVLGGIIGVVIGAALVLAQQWGGFISLGGDHSKMTITAYPVRLDVLDVVVVLGMIVIISVITGAVTRLFTRNID